MLMHFNHCTRQAEMDLAVKLLLDLGADVEPVVSRCVLESAVENGQQPEI